MFYFSRPILCCSLVLSLPQSLSYSLIYLLPAFSSSVFSISISLPSSLSCSLTLSLTHTHSLPLIFILFSHKLSLSHSRASPTVRSISIHSQNLSLSRERPYSLLPLLSPPSPSPPPYSSLDHVSRTHRRGHRSETKFSPWLKEEEREERRWEGRPVL